MLDCYCMACLVPIIVFLMVFWPAVDSMSPLGKNNAQGKLGNDVAKGYSLSPNKAHERSLWYAKHLSLRQGSL